jgi:hypothetical protein
VPALCSVLGTGDDEPVSIEVLKALYTIIAPDSSGVHSLSCTMPLGSGPGSRLSNFSAIYQASKFCSCSSAGHTTTEVFASGGVHALIRLLENVLEFAAEPQRSVWVREVLALLYPLVRRSRMVARLMVCPRHLCIERVIELSAFLGLHSLFGCSIGKTTHMSCLNSPKGLHKPQLVAEQEMVPV